MLHPLVPVAATRTDLETESGTGLWRERGNGNGIVGG
jgi:hypothetical protein